MGVQSVLADAFQRAKDYEAKIKAGDKTVRRDLELDALVEILNSKRFITCHSYVQSEILALLATADEYGFKVNTLTHILEGYKVADAIKNTDPMFLPFLTGGHIKRRYRMPFLTMPLLCIKWV
ncbi:hypothetical protein LWM68_24720 [Niabella sp. W65]|nr:hypothetical protein [Niabella sp. W65]MCH7365694.1 hypothetical protein [Niabella sp. W65]ULT41461.1 hypothetical protein KRR40_43630 [Niabella sp. I65]